MKKYPVLALFLTAMAVSCLPSYPFTLEAHSLKLHESPTATVDNIIFKLTISLSLTDGQARQIRPVIADDVKSVDSIMKSKKNDRDALRSALEDQSTKTNHRLSQYLTEAQMMKLDEMQLSQQNPLAERKSVVKKSTGVKKLYNRGTF